MSNPIKNILAIRNFNQHYDAGASTAALVAEAKTMSPWASQQVAQGVVGNAWDARMRVDRDGFQRAREVALALAPVATPPADTLAMAFGDCIGSAIFREEDAMHLMNHAPAEAQRQVVASLERDVADEKSYSTDKIAEREFLDLWASSKSAAVGGGQ